MLKISVIIPVFNAEMYIRNCVDSILNQSYSNFELILVNDNSSDASLKILKEYQARDNRIVLIDKKVNEGVSFARNDALKIATGQYIVFVDGDDWVDSNMFENMLESSIENDADLVMCSYIREFGNESKPKHIFDHSVIYDEIAVKKDLHRRMIGIVNAELASPETADALCTCWGKLYKRELIQDRNIEFYDIRKIGTYEDGLFNLHVLENVKKAVFMNECLYHYRRTNLASLTNAYNPRLKIQWDNLFDILQKYIDTNNLEPTYQIALNNRISLSLIVLGINVLSMKASVITKIQEIKNLISDVKYKSAIRDLKLNYMPMHWKLFFGCAKYNSSILLYVLLYLIQKVRGR